MREAKTLRIGIIGTGNMGGMLARAFAVDGLNDVWVHNRTPGKALRLSTDVANIHFAETAHFVVQQADTVFICTKLTDGQKLVEELGPLMTAEQTLVATISTMALTDMEEMTRACVAKIIPSIVQSVQSGVLLVVYGPRMNRVHRESLQKILGSISDPFTVSEEQIRICSDLTSCGPAFLAFLLLQWADAVACTGKLSYGESEHLLSETVIGLGDLLKAGMTLRDILQKVSVPGGVTETGLGSLQRESSTLFHNLHMSTATHTHGKAMANLPIRS
jgi:competence protein ComER